MYNPAYLHIVLLSLGHAVAQCAEALRYKPDGLGFDLILPVGQQPWGRPSL